MAWLRKKDVIERPVTALGSLVALGGLGGLFPGPKDVLAAAIAELVGTPDPAVSAYLAVAVMATGIIMVVCDQIAANRKKTPNRTLIAFRHHSLQPVSAPLLSETDLPKRLGSVLLEHRDCDQTAEMQARKQNYAAALGIQDRAWTWLKSRLESNPRPELAYYGIAHVPFQILMGYQLSQTNPLLFELSRQDRVWRELLEESAPHLGIQVLENHSKCPPHSAVIRISVSYPVELADIKEIIPEPFDDIELRINDIGIDRITHYGQVREIVAAFRSALDSSMRRIPRGGEVHLFYAGPMSLGFSLGKAISPSIHPKVAAYNHTRQSQPRYSWGVTVNSPDQLPDVVKTSRISP